MTTALLGTQRRGAADVSEWPGALGEAARGLEGDPAAALLGAAALGVGYRRAGTVAAPAPAPVVASPQEDRPVLPARAAARLEGLLGGVEVELFPEWLEVASATGYVAPPHLLPAMFEVASRSVAVRAAVTVLVGRRGRWLASLRPDWARLLVPSDPTPEDPAEGGTDEGAWTLGTPQERNAWLAAVRATDPERGREALERTWEKEAATGRAELLELLATGLCPADEAFLERGLDDRRKDVREVARRLLGRIPTSAFLGRAAERAGAAVTTRRTLLRTRLVVVLPEGLDDAARRDGLEDDPAATGRRAAWLQQIVAAAPLSVWEPLGAPEQILALPVEDGWEPVLRAGWYAAALRERDTAWARTLFRIGAGGDLARRNALLAVLPPEECAGAAELVLREVAQGPKERRFELGRVRDLATILREVPGPWPDGLTQAVLRWLAAAATETHPRAFTWLWPVLGLRLPVRAAGQVRNLAQRLPPDPPWHQALAGVADTLTTRAQMLEELR